MTTLNFDDEDELQDKAESSCPIASAGVAGEINTFHGTTANPSSASVNSSEKQFTVIAAMPSTEKLLNALIRQTEENSVLLRQALAELKELKMQVQSQRKIPFTVKTCGFERELVLKAKEVFVTYGPWLVQGALDKLKERIAVLLGGADKVDAHHVTSCVSYCKEKYTLWRADIRKKRKFANENGYFENTSKSDFWDMFVEFANSWNKIGIPNKWTVLMTEDEAKFTETLESVKVQQSS
ncbi:uncharacterized protein LOC114964616 isoform X2 [Acropora millepora]|uniref:uncharacterized protein LOC114964616 isoform X2 n=1 Tax=Acropora millepora TaxID=45264 RepID=UPI001CF5412B|nr:uncharacterized protein LOC114964616 isoform X2 [Acropora millepora]